MFPSNRGCVKRMKFAPGKGNMKLMVVFADGIDIWEAHEVCNLEYVPSLFMSAGKRRFTINAAGQTRDDQ